MPLARNLRACAAALAILAGTIQPAMAFEDFGFGVGSATESLRTELRGASLLLQARRDGNEDPQEVLAAARAEYSRLIGVLYANGYYGGTISIRVNGREAADFGPFDEPGAIRSVRVAVEPGPRYAFSSVSVEPQAPGTRLPDDFRAGTPASTTVIRQAAEAAVSGWRSVGHAKARVSGQSIVVRHPVRGVTADLEIDPGRRLTFGELQISGNKDVRTERIREIAGLPTGRAFDPEDLTKAANRLRRAGAFRSVSLTEAESANPDGSLDIALRLAEERPRRYGLGLEYSTVEGLALSAFWMHRNLLGGSERLRVEGEWAGIDGNTGGMDYRVGARFTRPATRDPDTDLYVVGEIEQLNEPDFTSNSISGAIGYTRIATDILSVSVGVGFLLSQVEDQLGTEEYRFLALPLGATRDTRTDKLNPGDGTFADLHLMPFLGVSGSSSGARFTADTRAYTTFGDERPIVLAGRLQFGSIIGAPVDGVPNDMRFYSGGGGTVRGQDYQSLGIEFNGVDSGGRSFLGLSAEARLGVTETIGVVAFADWGYVGEDYLPGDNGGSHAGAGLGLRYNTGIGPIRFDVATPVTGEDAGGTIFIYIGIGQAF